MQWLALIGMATGMRSMTGLAVLCWCAWLGLIPETGWASWSATLVAAIVFGLCAVAEYVGDLSPKAPSRTTAFPLTVRLVFGAVAGALVAHSMNEPVVGGVIFALIGVLIGAFGGVWVRVRLAKLLRRDWPVGVVESLLALGLCLVVVAVIHHEAVWYRGYFGSL
jgi:uncharacterized membrane protein